MSSSLTEEIQAELQMRLAEKKQLQEKAALINMFIRNIEDKKAELDLVSSSARKARDHRDLNFTMSPEEEIAQYKQELEEVNAEIEALEGAIELLEQQL